MISKVSGPTHFGAGGYTDPVELIGLSTDTKPTDVPNTSFFYEMDTKKIFLFDAENAVWLEQ